MLPGLILLAIHAVGWGVAAFFALRLIGWYPRGCRQIFRGIALDVLSLSVWYFPEASRNVGLPAWNALLGTFGLRPDSPQLPLIAFMIAFVLELGAIALCVRAFVGACRAAEELRYARRSATDREAVKSADR
ncbi:hypothetical protein [Planctellipticum variicoloris]|jgi:hypothetical protein|uniref:hypothetical protein n=1 Tax=Planctellipticum variicoloris TaxID=3064265 RepID=UPI003013CF1B|nr:hypothetical protein SH412_005110 [Planctomycetaceae bacterium SH412]